jgi:ParB family chromosome partitioning protein
MASKTPTTESKAVAQSKPAAKAKAPAQKKPASKPASTATSTPKKEKPLSQINTLARLKEYGAEGTVNRGDGWTMDWRQIQEEPGFNPRDYDSPREIAHISKMADAYARGEYFPPIVVVVRNGDAFVRDGHCRLRAIAKATAEGRCQVERVEVKEFKGDESAQLKLVDSSSQGLSLTPLGKADIYGRYNAWGWSDQKIADYLGGRSAEHVRQYRSTLGFPMHLKKLVNDGTIKVTLALELYKQYGTESVALVQQAVAEAEAEQKQEAAALAAAGFVGAELVATAEAPQAQSLAAASGAEATETSPATDVTDEVNRATPEAEKPQIKITKKHIQRVAGKTPALPKKVVAEMTNAFRTLGGRLESAKPDGDGFLLRLTADEFHQWKLLTAHLPAEELKTPSGDEKQQDLLDNPNGEDPKSNGTMH